MKTLTKRIPEGGLNLVDLSCKQKAVKISRIFDSLEDTICIQCIETELCSILGNTIWRCNLSTQMVRKCFSDSYWRDVLLAWSEINFVSPETKADVSNQILWYNAYIILKGKPFIWKTWFKKGIIFVEDIVDANGKCRDHIDLGVNWLELRTLYKILPESWKWLLEYGDEVTQSETLFSKLCKMKKTSKFVYNLLIDSENVITKYKQRWEEDGLTLDLVEYKSSFVESKLYTTITKFSDFQYRLLLNKLVTNVNLASWGITDNPNCNFCNAADETTVHILFECCKVKHLIEEIESICIENKVSYCMTKELFILNKICKPINHIINTATVIMKQFIYRCRCQCTTPNIRPWKHEIMSLYKIEMFNAKRDGNLSKMMKKWEPISVTINRFSAST